MFKFRLDLTLFGLIKLAVVLDAVWAATLATVQTLVLNQAGVAIGATGAATKIAAGATWFATFVFGLVYGAMLMFFFGVLAVLWLFLYAQIAKTATEKTKAVTFKYLLLVVVGSLAWGAVSAVLQGSVVAAVGGSTAVDASPAVTTTVTLLTGFIAFVLGTFQGFVAATVFTGFVLMMAFLFVRLFGRKKRSGDSSNPAPSDDAKPPVTKHPYRRKK